MVGYLIGEEGPFTGLLIQLEEGEEWIIGRDPDVVFQVLEDPMVSRRHVIFRKTVAGYTVENLSTINPAKCNGIPISDTTLLHEADLLEIGNSIFRFSLKDPKKTEEEPSFPKEDFAEISFGEESESRWMIKVVAGPNNGAEFGMREGESYIIGKDPDQCDLVFQDLSVSRQHARISVSEEGKISIEDLHSRNGVFVNGSMIESPTELSSQDSIAFGTTTFLIIDHKTTRETIFAPAPLSYLEKNIAALEEQQSKEEESLQASKKDWKQLIIPTKHLIIAIFFIILIFIGFAGIISLFKSQEIVMVKVDEEHLIKQAIHSYTKVEFSLNSSSGKLFILGHVLTEVDHQELMHTLETFPFITSIEDNIIIDELVVENFNALLVKNPVWRSVTLMSPKAGKFLLRGYVDTAQAISDLLDYVRRNFTYLDLLDNKVVAEKTLTTEIQALLLEKGFVNIALQSNGGEVILAGRVNEGEEKAFQAILQNIRNIEGVVEVKNFVIFTTTSTAQIDVSAQYRVTGTSKFGVKSQFVVINGKILTSGDLLDSMLITEITSNTVLLEKDGIKYKINYNQQ